MKANELMIGDWVFNNNHPTQVTRIECNSVADMECEIDIFHRINPIPLTEEILKANGWRIGINHLERACISFETVTIDIIGKELITLLNFVFDETSLYSGFVLRKANLQYVHELQHALRLCGLNDLANNFKL